MSRFSDATAVTPTGDGHYTAIVHQGWDIGGNANGGYLMAIAGRAMADAAGRPPLTLTAHYLRPAPAGDCAIEVVIVRSGRRLATATATLSIAGKPTLQLLGSFGEQVVGGPSRLMEEPVDLPEWDDCVAPPSPTEGPKPAIMEKINVRMRPGDEGFRRGEPTGAPR